MSGWYLLAAGRLTGVFQIAWGYLRLAHQMRFVPQPVMEGSRSTNTPPG